MRLWSKVEMKKKDVPLMRVKGTVYIPFREVKTQMQGFTFYLRELRA